jgi:iron complex outermembrane receptor protein
MQTAPRHCSARPPTRSSRGWRLIGGGHIDQDQDAWAANDCFTSTSYTDTVFIPKQRVEYDVAANQTLAIVYQRGYRPGGSSIYVADGSQYSYDPEWTNVVELSWRARLLDNRLRVAATAFYQNWEDQQVEIQDDLTDWQTARVVNAGKSTSYGGEVELAYQATSRLQVLSSIGLLHTKFNDFEIGSTDYSGLPFPAAPEQTVALGYLWGGDTGWFSLGNVKYTNSFMSRLEAGGPSPSVATPTPPWTCPPAIPRSRRG